MLYNSAQVGSAKIYSPCCCTCNSAGAAHDALEPAPRCLCLSPKEHDASGTYVVLKWICGFRLPYLQLCFCCLLGHRTTPMSKQAFLLHVFFYSMHANNGLSVNKHFLTAVLSACLSGLCVWWHQWWCLRALSPATFVCKRAAVTKVSREAGTMTTLSLTMLKRRSCCVSNPGKGQGTKKNALPTVCCNLSWLVVLFKERFRCLHFVKPFGPSPAAFSGIGLGSMAVQKRVEVRASIPPKIESLVEVLQD